MRRIAAAILLSFLLVAQGASAQPYGLDAPVPVGAFLDGIFPTTTPTPGAGANTYATEPAYPALTGVPSTVLVIATTPADDRIYLGSRDGEIVSFQDDPAATTVTPFMDLRDRVATVADGGFLGLAFHPDFGQAGSPYEFSFYVWYSSYCPTDVDGAVDFAACNPNYPQEELLGFFGTWLRLSRFQAYFDPVDQVFKGDPASEEAMINIRLYNNSHRGGGPIFGPDGYLYLAIGDQYRYITAQDIQDTLEGGSLRLAVDVTENGDGTWTCPAGSHQPRRDMRGVTGNSDEISGRLYCIPDDNPWLDPGGSVLEEYFTIGHRNPHRISFDPVTGYLWSGEVGQIQREEVNILLSGGNYGWPYKEGNADGYYPLPGTVLGTLTPPLIDFERDVARTIIGGYVYRGTQFPELVGRYIAGDWSTNNIWALDLDEATMTATAELLATFDPGGLATFGVDHQGELLLGSVFPGVGIRRFVAPGTIVPDPPGLLSQIGAFTDVTTLEPSPAAVPFEPLTFWSDGARKSRWIFVPNDGIRDQPDEQIVFSANDSWDFPVGTVLMKHFELPLDASDPDLTVRLETRFLVKGEDAQWYGLSYRWDPDQLDAHLLTGGETATYTVQTPGGPLQQTWAFPSRSDCLRCHNAGVGGPAGPRTHGLNRDLTYPATGRSDNQLRTWNHLGMFATPLVESEIATYLAAAAVDDPSASLEFRARSYLDTNCSYCHRPDTGNRASFDARLTTPLEDQGLIWGGVIDPRGLVDPHLITPGDPSTSLIPFRVGALGPDAMPPLAKDRVDQAGLALLGEWILRVDSGYPRQGLHYDYYEETGLTALPDFDLLTPVKSGSASSFDLSLRDRDDDFAFRFEGQLEVPTAGDWTFFTSSDEGSQLFIDDVLVVDNDGLHTNTEVSGQVTLGAGFHAIRVTTFEATGPEVLNVSWQGPGTAKQQVPANLLYQQVPTPITNAPPTLTPPGDQLSDLGDVVSLPLAAGDPDGDLLYFSATGLPPGLSLDPGTGVIQGTLGSGSAGVHAVTVGVSDGPDAASASFLWTVTDTSPPSLSLAQPADGATVSGLVPLHALASDDDGVVGVQFRIDGAPLGAEDTDAPYVVLWPSGTIANGSHQVAADARDASGNTSSVSVVVNVDNPADGPVAAWGFDEGFGSVASDASGRAHDGSLSGASWSTSGRYGGALSFDGVDDVVLVPDADDLDLPSGVLTLSAWVYPTALGSTWSPVLHKEPDAYLLEASSTNAGRAAAGVTLDGICCAVVYAPATDNLPLDTWTHVAVTYDGADLVYYIDGNAVASLPASGALEITSAPLRIGNNTYAGEAFQGLLDEVRVYDRVLSPGEIQTVMATPLPPSTLDVTPPTVTLTAPADGATLMGTVPVQATAADDVGVAGVQFLLDGLPLGAEDTTVPYTVDWDTFASGNGSYTVSAQARDLSGKTTVSPAVTVTVDNPPDVTPPTVDLTAPLAGATLAGIVPLQATAADDLGVVGVQFLLDGVPLGAEDTTAPYGYDWNTLAVADGAYTLSAEARDAAGNTAVSAGVPVSVDNTTLAPVAAWAFDDGAGTVAVDATGRGHDGELIGGTWSVAGRYGGALAFDGVTDVVLVPDAADLDLTTGAMTLAAWVRPTALSADWAPVMQKETDAYFLHASSSNGSRAAGGATLGGVCCDAVYAPPASTLPVDAWSHLAVTYDGAQLVYYLDGVPLSSAPASGAIENSSGPLRIGNNTYLGEAFTGLLDEVRVYDRALTENEIQTVMSTPLAPPAPDGTPPSVSITAPLDGATVSGVVTITADATDDVAVAGVQFLLDGAPFGAEDTQPPYEIDWNTGSVLEGGYILSAEARDSSGNTATAVDVGVTVVHPPDIADPQVQVTAPLGGATLSGVTILQATASDDVGVAGVQFLLDGAPLGPEDVLEPYSYAWDTTAHPDGPYVISAEARDAAGKTGLASDVPVTLDNSSLAPVAAWTFEEGAGSLARDVTGRGHTGAVNGAAWTPGGRNGGALLFDGVDDVVVVPDRPDLDMVAGEMTLSAWIHPTALGASWSPVMQKEVDAYLLHASSSNNGRAAGGATLGGACCSVVFAPSATSVPLDAWSHVAVTYDGALLVYYVDGTQVASLPASGAIEDSAGSLRIGNNTYPGEAFTGIIDDVHVYDRALSAAEVQRDSLEVYVPEPGGLLGLASCCGMLALLRRLRLSSRSRPRA